MGRSQELYWQAWTAYKADRHGEAALLYRQAAEAALEIGDRAKWFDASVWAVDAVFLNGDIRTALSLLLAALIAEPENAPALEAWYARRQAFSLKLRSDPDLRALDASLEDLHRYAAGRAVPAADLLYCEGDLAFARGDWVAALKAFESAWTKFNGQGYVAYNHAQRAAECCLRLRRWPAVKDWIDAMEQSGWTDWAELHVVCARLRLELAVAQGEPVETLLALLREHADLMVGPQQSDELNELRLLTVRVSLLDSSNGDPHRPFHPARSELQQRWANRHCVHTRYAARLLLVDYHLASLRYTAGMDPVNDVYCACPQRLPKTRGTRNASEFVERLRRARVAGVWALTYGRRIDGVLGCGWREHEVVARLERIDEIAARLAS